jgi:polysaccharide export outer membrane protein
MSCAQRLADLGCRRIEIDLTVQQFSRQVKAMKAILKYVVGALACGVLQQTLVVAAAQERRPRIAVETPGPAETTQSGKADGAWSPALTGERRPLYRLRRSDVIEIDFTFAPEFNQTVSVLPDGFIMLRDVPELYAAGATVPELRAAINGAYGATLHDPEVTIAIKDFERPYFIVSGQVSHAGKYELRADTTVTEALAIAGGFTEQAKHSQVLLLRRISDQVAEAHLLNVKHMMNSRNLSEDVHLEPGDLIFVPQNTISKVRRYLPTSSLSLYSTPTQF